MYIARNHLNFSDCHRRARHGFLTHNYWRPWRSNGSSVTAKRLNLVYMMSFFFPLANFSTFFVSMSIVSPDQKDIRGHPDHHSGYGDHRRLRCVWVFPPQSIHRVGQVHCIWDISQQTKHCQETGQPTGDRAVLLHGEWRFSNEEEGALGY